MVRFLALLVRRQLSQLAGTYANLSQELRIVRGVIAKLASTLLSLIQGMNSAALTFDYFRMWLELLRNRCVRLSQKMDAR